MVFLDDRNDARSRPVFSHSAAGVAPRLAMNAVLIDETLSDLDKSTPANVLVIEAQNVRID
jgi:hypothetical protein